MPDDLTAAFGRGFAAFAHSRAGRLIEGTFQDAGTLLGSLADGTSGTTRPAFDALKARAEALGEEGAQLKAALEPHVATAKAAVADMAAELDAPDFGPDELLRCLVAAARLVEAYDEAVGACAKALSTPTGLPERSEDLQRIKDDINGMNAPIRMALAEVGDVATDAFDALCRFVLGRENASREIGTALKWDHGDKKLSLKLASAGATSHPPLQFDGATVETFFQFKEDIKAGVVIKGKLKAGLRSGPLLDRIMPGQGSTADSEGVAVTLDTKSGLTFGSGPNKRLVLPVRFAWPGVELREFALERPENKNRLDVAVTIAGRLGDVFAAVAEGAGVTIRLPPEADYVVEPRPPRGVGLRLNTPAVKGGGYLRLDPEKGEYGGVLQVEVAKIGITAIGLLGTKPSFSLVVVIGVRFKPRIELGFGFTLNGLGGILAIERTIDTEALAAGLRNDVVGQLLFPSDPVAAAPQILDRLGEIFPRREGGFVLGPIAELGWGSQAGFVKARLGVVLALPDPRVVILGAVQVGVPSTEVPPQLRLVDLKANLMGEITADQFFFKASLADSRIFALTVSGDMAAFVQWTGEGMVAFSVGGFFPDYEAPPRLGHLERATIRFAPPTPGLNISVSAYVAITSNSVQFGGRLDLAAKVGPAAIKGWAQVDALLQWAPVFRFETRLDIGLRVEAFGETMAGVQFRGTLRGDKPWFLEGRAEVEILWWDIPIPIGPLEWGERPPTPPAVVDLIHTVAQTLRAKEALTPLLPPGAASLVRLAPADAVELHHPLGELEIRQQAVPLEYEIDRIGSARVSTPRVHLTAPRLGGGDAGAVWPVTAPFPPGHFLDLSDDEVMSRPEFETLQAGLGLSSVRGAAFTDPSLAVLRWETVYPHHDFPSELVPWNLGTSVARALASGAVTVARAERDNPYLEPRQVAGPVLTERGLVGVHRIDTLEPMGLGALSPSLAARVKASAGGGFTFLDAGALP